MAKSAQERQAWREQELRFRREEETINLRWFWTLIPVTQLVVNWDLLRSGRSLWLISVIAVIALGSMAMAVRAWRLTFRHRKAAQAPPDDCSDEIVK